jgi:deazaflavin-dependent oxidoreductase (nitroreductase family)
MAEVNDWNRSIIAEFRANGGNVGGQFAQMPLLLLTTTGAKTGQVRTNPLAYLGDGGRWFVFASKAGAPTSPDWYHNLVAHPNVKVEVGTESFDAVATVLTGEERDQVYARQAALHPVFAEYQQRTKRAIPVVALARSD